MQGGKRVDVAVIGGGLCGLVCALRLRRSGIDAVCFEATGRVGGALRSHRQGGFVIEGGANTVQETEVLTDLIRDLDYADEIVRTPPRLARFIHRHGVLHRLPDSVAGLLTTKVVSQAAKLRILGEVAIPRRTAEDEESIADFVIRRFGAETLAAFVAPLVAGTFAGDPAKLSASALFPRLVELERKSGSVLRGMIAGGSGDAERRTSSSLVSLRGGIELLAERIADRLGDALLRNALVARVSHAESGYEVVTGSSVVSAAAIVVALPAWTAAELLRSVAPEAAALLAEIEAPRLACVSLAWRRSDVDHSLDGLGFLVAPGESVRILGCLWPSSMFGGRAPEGEALFTAFVGGARNPESAALDDAALSAAVAADLGKIVGARGEPRVLSIDRYERAIPQYTIGHRARVERIRAALASHSGIFLAGNYLEGISVSDCIRQASATAEAVEKHGETAVDLFRRGV